MRFLTLRYTPGQLREIVAIPQETYRHWKKALPPLDARGRGHSPCFTPGDLIAVAVVRVLTTDLAIRVGRLQQIAGLLFEACNGIAWPSLERSRIVVDFLEPNLELLPESEPIAARGLQLIIPLRSIVAELRGKLVAAAVPDSQESLRFPPTLMNANGRTSAARSRR